MNNSNLLREVKKVVAKKGYTDKMIERARFGGFTPGERDFAKARLQKARRILDRIRERNAQ